MIKNIYDYVCFDISDYIKQVGRIVPSEPSFVFRQALDYILPTVLIKMTGCLEHKLDMINLQLSIDDEQKKQRVLRGNTSIPGSSEDVDEVIISLDIAQSIISGRIKRYENKLEIWQDETAFSDTIRYVSNLIHDNGLDLYLSKEDSLLALAQDADPNYVSNQISLYELAETGTRKKSRAGNDIIKSGSPYKLFYNQAIRFRNIYAHNEESVNVEVFSPRKLSFDSTALDNWGFRFSAVLYVDSAIRNAFVAYMNARTAIMLS